MKVHVEVYVCVGERETVVTVCVWVDGWVGFYPAGEEDL